MEEVEVSDLELRLVIMEVLVVATIEDIDSTEKGGEFINRLGV